MPSSSRRPDGSFPSSSSSISSQISVASTYRHHHAELIPTPTKPQPILLQDAQHAPKTRGSLGLLIVGLTGHRGLAVTAGLMANQSVLSWKGPKGEPRQASYQGCQTQQQQFTMPHDFHLANANLAAIGGWVRAIVPRPRPHRVTIHILACFQDKSHTFHVPCMHRTFDRPN